MEFKRDDFRGFSSESQRVVANLEQVYDAWADTRRQLEAMPVSLYWVEKGGVDYLAVKQTSRDNGTTVGRRSDATARQFEEFTDEKNRLKLRLAGLATQLVERAGIYRRLRLPSLPDRQAEILRRLDIEGMLGSDLMVVGTNAFAAYELACGARFPVGNEETEDFDLAWCRVELLAAPSVHPLPAAEAFDPMASLIEQEWLLLGEPLRHVVATLRGRACPLYVPDPRWMALHKLWLADKPERKASKREKDRRQGEVLLDATRFFLSNSHPIDVAFVLDLPEDLRTHFDDWASTRAFVPA